MKTERMFDRDPPNAADTEECLLGALILDHRMCSEVQPIIAGPEVFYVPKHGTVYASIMRVWQATNGGDIALIIADIRKHGSLDDVGGAAFIEECATKCALPSNAVHYAKIVAEKYRVRRLINASSSTLHDCYHPERHSMNAQELIDTAEARVFAVADEQQATEIIGMGTAIKVEYERLKAIAENRAAPMGIHSGFYELDKFLYGLQAGEMIVVAARPSMGKSAFAMNIAEQVATGRDGSGSVSGQAVMSVGMFSLEMSIPSLAQRLLASFSGVDAESIRRGTMPMEDLAKVAANADALKAMPIVVDDTAGLTIQSLHARARRMVNRYGIKLILIDYLQLLTAPNSSRENRQVEVSAISRSIKALARDLRMPVICLSQLNRAAELREGHRPKLADLRESGSIENDADVVLLLHREEHFHIGDTEWFNNNPTKIGAAEVIVAKQRNGRTGSFGLVWNARCARFYNAAQTFID